MWRRPRSLQKLVVAILLAGCQRTASPQSTVRSSETAKSSNSPPLVVQTRKVTDESQRLELAAREFLQALLSGPTKAAIERTSLDFRRLLSGPLTFTEERQLGYSNIDVEKFLTENRGNCREFQLRRRYISPDGQSAWFRGTLQGEGKFRTFSLSVAPEGASHRVSWFFAAEIPAAPSLPDPPTPELGWAAEFGTDFLLLVFGSPPDHTLTMSLLTEEFKASLPSPSVADAGLKYAKRDVRTWLNSLRSNRTGFLIDSLTKDDEQVSMRGRFSGAAAGNFVMVLTKEANRWKVHRFELSSATPQ